MSAASATPPEAPRIRTLDGLRGIAVWLILIHHFVGLSPLLEGPAGSTLSYVRAALGLTPTGVDLFFVLSGFLIGGILMDHAGEPGSFRVFYARRALRILPLAMIHIGLVWLLFITVGPAVTGEIGAPWWVYAAFLSNGYYAMLNGWELGLLTCHWSLAIEEQFYLIFPLVVAAWPRRHYRWIGPGLIAVALVARTSLWACWPERLPATHFLTPCRLDALGAGFVCAWLVRQDFAGTLLQRRGALWLTLGLLALPLCVLLKQQYRAPELMSTWGYTAVALFYATLLLLVYRPQERWLAALMTNPALVIYGRFSYFIYLFQGLLGAGLVNLLFHGTWQTNHDLAPWEIAAVPILLLAPAAISWRWLEAPLIRLGHRMQYAVTR